MQTIHPTEETLEQYCLSRLAPSDLDSTDEHLLVCDACRERLDAIDEYVQVMKMASGPPLRKKMSASFALLQFVPALAIACAVATLVFFLPRHQPVSGLETSVNLIASRGIEPGTVVEASAHRPIGLRIDTSEVRPSPSYTVDVVNAQGRVQWHTVAASTANGLDVHPGVLSSGLYWVRLFAADQPKELLREFALEVTD